MTPIRLRIEELRNAQGWSQRDLAEAAGVRQATISKAES
ncbi:MAG: helix-turn-helix domain-containing protein, partial [Gemmatimonadaceae bacterium]